ncbi:3-isopropylmalate dehydratase small subunit [Desulfosporosinus sp. PR]|uniref:LeuD/DmdB family oxidoreductase small subunit n=1 Tax=Candidatus Desulfosporosinus nitrosoreducens TaxID=3401928 RepID=UPI0027EF7CDF|nr:3-isopropylmalate dehydratase small subunit [Desulfosporosinus sp. PR]MDQ7094867.1 3-isopropylmalate dehydratase small subunit [Desulfosporosinus sp. PR]
MLSSLSLIKGKCWVLGDDINTDQIISTRYMLLKSKEEMSKYTLESVIPEFSKYVNVGDFIVAGKNFGRGSAREQAPEALKALKIGGIVAQSYSPIFFRNSVNIGIPTFVCRNVTDYVEQDDLIEVNIFIDNLKIINKNIQLDIEKMPTIIKKIMDSGGLVNFYLQYHM